MPRAVALLATAPISRGSAACAKFVAQDRLRGVLKRPSFVLTKSLIATVRSVPGESTTSRKEPSSRARAAKSAPVYQAVMPANSHVARTPWPSLIGGGTNVRTCC